ncbi:MAG: thiamine phosphate synthase [Aureispira sp.]
MQHRLYTWPDFLEGEGGLINALFEMGLPLLHLRKPQATLAACRHLLEQIDRRYHQRIMVHQHWELTALFELGGIHWTERSRALVTPLELEQEVKRQQAKGLQVGTAIHHPQQLAELPASLDYVTVSPIFESISKLAYKANYYWENRDDYSFVLVALGGIEPSNLALVQKRGFSSVAVLGAIWKPQTAILQNYQHLCQALQQL